MKSSLVAFFITLLSPVLFAASGTAIPGGNQAASFIITKPGAYYLAADRTMTDKTALAVVEIQASDVTLDLNGFTLRYVDSTGTNGGLGAGIFSVGANVEIRNGSVASTPSWGVVGVQGSGFRLVDVRLRDTQGVLAHGRGALVERCQISKTRGRGISSNSQGGVIKDCEITETEDFSGTEGSGIVVGTMTRITGCAISYTSHAAIRAEAFNFIDNNTLSMVNMDSNPNVGGIMLHGGKNSVARNSIQLARGTGIRVQNGVRSNVLTENIISSSVKINGLNGEGIISGDPTTILRGNIDAANDALLFITGAYTDGGSNMGE